MDFIRKQMIKSTKKRVKALLIVGVLFIVFNSWFMYMLEPDTFGNPFNASWWLLTTVTTVGFGDLAPVTFAGRAWAMLVVFTFGIGIFGVVVGWLAESFFRYRQLKEEGKLMYKGKNHYVIIGWTTKSESTIRQLLASTKHDIVLIDRLEKSPLGHDRFHYVKGSPTEFDTFSRARLEDSKAVLVFAPAGISSYELADGQTLLITTSIESYEERFTKKIYTIVEILKENHMKNFKHVKVDEIILSYQSVSNLMAKSAQTKGASQIFTELVAHSNPNSADLWKIAKRPEWTTYRDAYMSLKEQGALLVSDGKDMDIIQKLDQPISDSAELFIISTRDVYERIK